MAPLVDVSVDIRQLIGPILLRRNLEVGLGHVFFSVALPLFCEQVNVTLYLKAKSRVLDDNK